MNHLKNLRKLGQFPPFAVIDLFDTFQSKYLNRQQIRH